MGAEDSDCELPPSVFFTYRLEDREEHLSPQEVRAASHLGQLYPFLGSNGVPQHFKHTSQAVNEGLSEGLSEGLLRKPVEPAQSRAERRSVLREKTGNYRVAAPGKENLQPARGGGGELAGVHKSSRRKVGAAEQDISGKDSDNNTQVRINDFSPPPLRKKTIYAATGSSFCCCCRYCRLYFPLVPTSRHARTVFMT